MWIECTLPSEAELNAGCDVNNFDTQTIFFSQRHISTGQNVSYNNAMIMQFMS